jgi:hypothetical protein
MDWTNFVAPFEVADEVPNDYLVERIKIWRRSELEGTDYTQLPDVPVDKAAFATYRADLRALTKQGSDARLWVFPIRPE